MSRRRRPFVSILIPAYNSEQWIASSIQSALEQTWPDKEIIVVNDGSTDATPDICRQYASNNVHVVSQENQGAAAARNKAYSLSQGDYIQWLDADDLLAHDKIALQVAALEKGATSRTLLSCAWGYFFHRSRKAQFSPTALWTDLNPDEWMMRQMEHNIHMQTATWLVSRELTDAAGPWDVRMQVDDDGEYFCRVMLNSDSIRFVPDARVYYRRSGASTLSTIGNSMEKKDAQYLSMRLHILYLLTVNDSERARAACRQYLQNWMLHFHPSRPDIVQNAERLAQELGGTIKIPQLSWKYRWIQKFFGWRSARRAQLLAPRIKQDVIRSCDKALSRFE